MKCQSQVSSFCKKTFKKTKVKHIWVDEKPLEVCDQCYWILKQRIKEDSKPSSLNSNTLKKLIEARTIKKQ